MSNFSLLRTRKELDQWLKEQNCHISLIPTMGSLHKGHGELIKRAQKYSSKEKFPSLISIFVNPLQFGPSEDFKNYPRDLKNDIEFVKNSGGNAIWAPEVKDIFPKGENLQFKLSVPIHLKKTLCGDFRKGHFDGVATVVLYLLKIVKPNILILGEKDWQQLVIVRALIKDLDLPVKVVGVATVRESDGLAYSSRNQYLSKSERKKSVALPNVLKQARINYREGKRLNLNQMKVALEKSALQVEYLDIVDPYNLQSITKEEGPILLAGAVKCGNTRLIDHTFLMKRKPIVAIDGPAGAGKSTVTRLFANQMGLIYLDTGSMYRAVAWLINNEKIDLENYKKIEKLLSSMTLELEVSKEMGSKVIINGTDVTEAIRAPEITSIVSVVASQNAVRKALTIQQKSFGEKGGIVAEGRDIGSTVFPNAELKIFLTASVKERALRRSSDLEKQGFMKPNIKDIENQIITRDNMDSNREISPLIKANDAIEINTDGISIEEVVKNIYELFRSKIPEEVWPS